MVFISHDVVLGGWPDNYRLFSAVYPGCAAAHTAPDTAAHLLQINGRPVGALAERKAL